jgi:hypothetical protein
VFEVLTAAWKTPLPLSAFEQLVLARLADATNPQSGLAWLSLETIAKDCHLTKLGAHNVLMRLTDERTADGKDNPRYCVRVIDRGSGRRTTQYRVLLDRLAASGRPRLPIADTARVSVAVNEESVAVNTVLGSGKPSLPKRKNGNTERKYAGAGAAVSRKRRQVKMRGKETGRTGTADTTFDEIDQQGKWNVG